MFLWIPMYKDFYLRKKLGPVVTMPEIFKKAALFLRLGLPSTLIPHENVAF